jgi:hypothetical protein
MTTTQWIIFGPALFIGATAFWVGLGLIAYSAVQEYLFRRDDRRRYARRM